jgi:hypothetical protein
MQTDGSPLGGEEAWRKNRVATFPSLMQCGGGVQLCLIPNDFEFEIEI